MSATLTSIPEGIVVVALITSIIVAFYGEMKKDVIQIKDDEEEEEDEEEEAGKEAAGKEAAGDGGEEASGEGLEDNLPEADSDPELK